MAGAGWFGSRSGAGAGLGFLIGLAYQWFMLTRNNGQTIGKMVMNIRVVKTNGMPLTAGDVIVRYIGYYINTALYGLGWFWAAFDGQRQGWHDKLAGTVVVRAS
ncbi:MAG: RDD family protein [Chloroflexota bacterium]